MREPAPLVLLHPWGSTGAMTWAVLVRALEASGRRAVAPDLPGHGRAAALEFTWSSATASALRACDRLSGAPAVLVGLSLGAAVALHVAAEHPDRVAGLVLTGAGAFSGDRAVRASLVAAGLVGAALAAVGWRQPLAYAAGHRGGNAASAARGASVSAAGLVRAALALQRFDPRGLPRPTAPGAVIVLTADRRMPPGLQRGLARHYGYPSFDVAADHDAPVTAPAALCSGLARALDRIDDMVIDNGNRFA
jgi:pimeloyl-ACP methyl ester carboxylesterase